VLCWTTGSIIDSVFVRFGGAPNLSQRLQITAPAPALITARMASRPRRGRRPAISRRARAVFRISVGAYGHARSALAGAAPHGSASLWVCCTSSISPLWVERASPKAHCGRRSPAISGASTIGVKNSLRSGKRRAAAAQVGCCSPGRGATANSSISVMGLLWRLYLP